MSFYVVDLGFNWNARPNGTDAEGTDFYLLQWGLVLFPPDSNEPTFGTLVSLQDGDTFVFNIYDLTQRDSNVTSPEGTAPTLGSNWLNCSSASTTTPAGSGLTTSSPIDTAQIGPESSLVSFIFAGANLCNVWPVVNPGPGAAPFVATVARPTPDPAPMGVLNYFFGWQITVTSPGQPSKLFKTDVQMIVNPG